MFIIDWVLDKFGFVQKASIEFPIAKPVAKKPAKIAIKKVAAKKKAAPRKRRLG